MNFIKTLFSIVFFVALAAGASLCGYMSNKYSTREKINALTVENAKLIRENNELYQNVEDLNTELERIKTEYIPAAISDGDQNANFNLNPEKALHDISEKRNKCVAEATNDNDKRQCYFAASDSWTKEMNDTLAHLKREMAKNEYELVEYSQNAWNEHKTAEEHVINKFITDKGTIYTDVAAGAMEKTDGARAIFLNKLYTIYTNQY